MLGSGRARGRGWGGRGDDPGLAGGEPPVGLGRLGSVRGDQRYAVRADDAPGLAGLDAGRDLAGLALGDRSQRLEQAELVVDRIEVAALVPVPQDGAAQLVGLARSRDSAGDGGVGSGGDVGS